MLLMSNKSDRHNIVEHKSICMVASSTSRPLIMTTACLHVLYVYTDFSLTMYWLIEMTKIAL